MTDLSSSSLTQPRSYSGPIHSARWKIGIQWQDRSHQTRESCSSQSESTSGVFCKLQAGFCVFLQWGEASTQPLIKPSIGGGLQWHRISRAKSKWPSGSWPFSNDCSVWLGDQLLEESWELWRTVCFWKLLFVAFPCSVHCNNPVSELCRLFNFNLMVFGFWCSMHSQLWGL